MIENRTAVDLRVNSIQCLLACCFCLLSAQAYAQTSASPASSGMATVPVLMVSDIHFEPFWDPAKATQLAAVPAAQWNAILAAPASPNQQQRFAAMQKSCHAKGVDTSYPLLDSSLRVMRLHAGGAKFITLSGDLISHGFSCKFQTVFPHAAPADYRAFVEKTIDYVLLQLHGAFSGVPIYAALGNNDSDCGDYQLDAHSDFLSAEGRSFTAGFAAPERGRAQETFAAGGYYSVSLPAPIQHAHLLVLDDLFMSSRYQACGGKPDPAPAAAQIAWLRDQLAMARRNKEEVWVMSHIPPGVDPYSTAVKLTDVCGGKPAVTFLSSDALAATLAEFGDVVQLAIFAHTHMDELRLLNPSGASPASQAQKPVALKMVSSISPVDGNNPSFTVARVDPTTAVMTDYHVFAASDASGTTWADEYDYAKAYHEPSFSSSSVDNLIAGFKADPKGETVASQAYMNSYFGKTGHLELKAFWPQYVCALENRTPESYRSCVCTTSPSAH